MLKFSIIIFILIITGKILMSLYNINLARISLKAKKNTADLADKSWNMNILILIPALREQAVIRKTLDHFKKLEVEGIHLHIAIAGTNREKKIEGKVSTKETVLKWIEEFENSSLNQLRVKYYFFEANDQNGDRATQLNFAVEEFKKTTRVDLDLIGVYDADSLPSEKTLITVRNSYVLDDNLVACQQPVHFVDAANEMAKNKANPILVANALYQSTWTMIRELPRWIEYYTHSLKSNKIYMRNIYLIGHGEFLKYEAYEKFRFPEHEVTDGIQLGYRLGMSNKSIKPLLDFCSDDVPREVSQLIHQHKRWFGGCMRLKEAYSWSKENFNTRSFAQLLDGFWSQFSWAWASLISIVFVILGFICDLQLLRIVMGLILTYCYVIPMIAHQFLPVKIKVRFMDWLCLPIAIAIKGIGPNMYLLETFFYNVILKKSITYQKVERKEGSM